MKIESKQVENLQQSNGIAAVCDVSNLKSRITKKHNHDHFWIEDEVLYESYRTIRGLRYLPILEVKGMPDNENCNEACIIYIEKQYLNN